jgi:hypothetical protein
MNSYLLLLHGWQSVELVFCMEVKILLCLHFATFVTALVERHNTDNEHNNMQTLKLENLHKGTFPIYKDKLLRQS